MTLEECWEEYAVDQSGLWGTSGENIATLKAFECIFMGIINVAIRLGGIALFIMVIVGGFTYLTAGGDPKKAQMGRNVITYAVIGLALLILAWFILWFIERITGVQVTVFNITQG